MKPAAVGKVIEAFGNLLYVEFENEIQQGEVGFVHLKELAFACEVIEISGSVAKVQVFEDTRGIELSSSVTFTRHLLEAELGPGLIGSIVDGLQNPLEKIAIQKGFFLSRGTYIAPLDRKKLWNFKPVAKVGEKTKRGDVLGTVQEKSFNHLIMHPFSNSDSCRVTWIASEGDYTLDQVVARLKEDLSQKEVEVTLVQRWPIKKPLIEGKKIKPFEMMLCGLRIIDTEFPLLKGGTFCTPGPFGAGKTVLQHHLAKHSDVDVVVVAACGERAGEVVELLREFPRLIDERTGRSLMDRTCIICNTSSMPVAAREASVYLGATIAEYYRQMGLQVLLLADSTSRWAQAMREMSGRLEEIPGEEAFPAYLASRIFSFYERAGVITLRDGKVGSLTIGGSVSPAGGNLEEPVTQATLAVVGAFLCLSRERSDARRFPAIDPLNSWTKYLERAALFFSRKVENWEGKIKNMQILLMRGNEIQRRMEVVGEEGISIEDLIVYLQSELYDICYLQQNAFDLVDAVCRLDRQLELFSLLQKTFSQVVSFDTKDEARQYFLKIQNEIKNLNYLEFHSDEYHQQVKKIEYLINREVLA